MDPTTDKEEMENHPSFATKIDENEASILTGAFQSLKCGPEYKPDELAKTYKEGGNKAFESSKFQEAVEKYSEGLKVKCGDSSLNAVLYTNRAAAYYHMGKYRESLEDAIDAKALKRDHFKAIHRGALCCLQLERYDGCIEWCTEALKVKADLKKKGESSKPEEDKKIDRLIRAVKDRGINIEGDLTPEFIKFKYGDTESELHMTDDGKLVWPVVFIYPQHGESDFIENFKEDDSFDDLLRTVFEKSADWDVNKEYTPENLKVFYRDNYVIWEVNKEMSLKSVMLDKRFVQRKDASVEFRIVPLGYCEEFLSFIQPKDST